MRHIHIHSNVSPNVMSDVSLDTFEPLRLILSLLYFRPD